MHVGLQGRFCAAPVSSARMETQMPAIRVLPLLAWGCLLAGGLNAGVPECKTVESKDGTTAESCTRPPDFDECMALVKEAWKDKKPEDPPPHYWNGCSWHAVINTVRGGGRIGNGLVVPLMWLTSVSLVPSYRNSERMDITVVFEQPDHTYKKHVRKDVPITIEDKMPNATVQFTFPYPPVSVPTVEAREKGGAKEASHSYR